MTAATIAISPTSSPVIERRPRSRSFGAGTPTFSSDLAKLKGSACCNDTEGFIVNSYSDAIAIASTFDVLGPNSPLTRRLQLKKDGDWEEFMAKSGAVSGDAIDLEKLLRYCFDIAYKMPGSPSTKLLRSTAKISPPPIQV